MNNDEESDIFAVLDKSEPGCAESGIQTELDCDFELAADFVQTLGVSSLSSDSLLYLYARYKQALNGPCRSQKPSLFSFQARQKWDAWKALGDMGKETAMMEYVDFVRKECSASQFYVDEKSKESKGEERSSDCVSFGSCISRPVASPTSDAANEEEIDEPVSFKWVKCGDLKALQDAFTCADDGTYKDRDGMCLLHWAADRGFVEILEFLLSKGCDIDVQDDVGQTPLHYATFCEHIACVEVLLKHGANVSLRNECGETPADVTTNAEIRNLLT